MADRERRIVEAAGGIVWRRDHTGALVVLVAHRPRYDDWTFPKGKRDAGDADLAATALREVREETGLVCRLGREIVTVEYELDGTKIKRVTYWEMTLVEGDTFVANDEVDAIRWVAPAHAATTLTYEGDHDVLAAWERTAGQM